jgi:hypothetical protein
LPAASACGALIAASASIDEAMSERFQFKAWTIVVS